MPWRSRLLVPRSCDGMPRSWTVRPSEPPWSWMAAAPAQSGSLFSELRRPGWSEQIVRHQATGFPQYDWHPDATTCRSLVSTRTRRHGHRTTGCVRMEDSAKKPNRTFQLPPLKISESHKRMSLGVDLPRTCSIYR